MYHPRVSGTYYEMGNRYGTVLYKHGFRLSEQPAEKQEFGKRSEKELKRIFPEVLDEIHGFAEACHARYENMVAFLLSIGAFKVEGACSEFAAFNGSDVVFGRNYDFYYRFKKYTESYITQPKDGFASLGQTDVFIGREDGVNQHGLATAISFVGPTRTEPGVNFPLAVRCILDKCANVEEAVKTLSNASFATTNNYLLADKDGSMAVVEASPVRVRVRWPDPDHSHIVATNHFLHPEMLDMEDKAQRVSTTLNRYLSISDALQELRTNVDARAAKKVLSSHEGFVCSHMKEAKLGTLWSVTATLRKPSLYRAEGNPCKTRYKLDRRLSFVARRRG